MDIEDLLLFLSIPDSSQILGLIHNNRLFVNDSLSLREEQAVYDKLIVARDYGYEHCIVTTNGTYINST